MPHIIQYHIMSHFLFLLFTMNMSEQKMQENFNLDNLNLNRCYTIGGICKKLKFSSIEINRKPVNHFELDKNGKLVPMPPTVILMEAVVGEIAAQLHNWNMWFQQNGIITTSQGGHDFNVGGQRMVRASDVAFLTRDVYNGLTQQQHLSFQGNPFSLIFTVEVADLSNSLVFQELDHKIENDYFATESSVRLVWLVDSENKQIHLYS